LQAKILADPESIKCVSSFIPVFINGTSAEKFKEFLKINIFEARQENITEFIRSQIALFSSYAQHPIDFLEYENPLIKQIFLREATSQGHLFEFLDLTKESHLLLLGRFIQHYINHSVRQGSYASAIKFLESLKERLARLGRYPFDFYSEQ